MGWTVIVYDRYGLHWEHLREFSSNIRFNYHPYTAFQLVLPDLYRSPKSPDMDVLYYFSKDAHGESSRLLPHEELQNQDSDKQKTYDLSRMEYVHAPSVLFVDADELLFCPSVQESLLSQRRYQRTFLDGLREKGIQEVHLPRNNYFFRLPRDVGPITEVRYRQAKESDADGADISSSKAINSSREMIPYVFVNSTQWTSQCILRGYARKSVADMLGCWTRQFRHSYYPKHIDFYSPCPFHWNHLSCHNNIEASHISNSRLMCTCNAYALHRKPFKEIFHGCHLMHLNKMAAVYSGKTVKDVQERSEINFTPSLRAYPMWKGH
eukprot:CAMPEP_0185040648 /NCGR_PEP_ID=MMETSP1103-20130426/38953_1 /TAXON_ID=36769 /ORGANISM="Paraphysomonas bandaiensis, Strain Caron Lab Isolate" /LENGTH=322 /DNA_ID=CAMNT_0027580031 /DNA_START=670 /DNA_END=1638 /DNA_ORIENTATION=-